MFCRVEYLLHRSGSRQKLKQSLPLHKSRHIPTAQALGIIQLMVLGTIKSSWHLNFLIFESNRKSSPVNILWMSCLLLVLWSIHNFHRKKRFKIVFWNMEKNYDILGDCKSMFTFLHWRLFQDLCILGGSGLDKGQWEEVEDKCWVNGFIWWQVGTLGFSHLTPEPPVLLSLLVIPETHMPLSTSGRVTGDKSKGSLRYLCSQ